MIILVKKAHGRSLHFQAADTWHEQHGGGATLRDHGRWRHCRVSTQKLFLKAIYEST